VVGGGRWLQRCGCGRWKRSGVRHSSKQQRKVARRLEAGHTDQSSRAEAPQNLEREVLALARTDLAKRSFKVNVPALLYV
jgi:hypothetical protein